MMPYITEEIWQKVKSLAGKTGETIMHQPYPVADSSIIDEQSLSDVEWVKLSRIPL